MTKKNKNNSPDDLSRKENLDKEQVSSDTEESPREQDISSNGVTGEMNPSSDIGLPKEIHNLMYISISEKELKNKEIKKCVKNLIDAKIMEQRHEKIIYLSKTEFDIIKNSGSFVPKERYATKLADLKHVDEVGKYAGKRLVVIN